MSQNSLIRECLLISLSWQVVYQRNLCKGRNNVRMCVNVEVINHFTNSTYNNNLEDKGL